MLPIREELGDALGRPFGLSVRGFRQEWEEEGEEEGWVRFRYLLQTRFLKVDRSGPRKAVSLNLLYFIGM